MSIIYFNQLLNRIIDSGMTIELTKVDGNIAYEIQTGAKSNLTIYEVVGDDAICYYKNRYSEGICNSYEDFLYELKGCLCSRDYASQVFFDFLEQEGVFEKVIETKVSYK